MNLRKQEIIELRRKINECAEFQRGLEKELAERLALEESEKLEREQRIFELTVKEWHHDFKIINMWVFGPLLALMLIAFMAKGFAPYIAIRFILLYTIVVVAFYSGNYVAFKKGDTTGWFVGVGLFLGLTLLSIRL